MEAASLWNTRLVKQRSESSPIKSSESWKTKLEHLNNFSTFYFFIVCIISVFINIFVTLPQFYGYGSASWFLRSLFIVFIITEVLANFLVVKSTAKRNFTTNFLQCSLPTSVGPECYACNRIKPKRSHHCLACGKCVLRRDHHCFFTSTCIGHWNQRHFICFLLYVSIGCLYSMYNMVSYMMVRYVYPSPIEFGPGLFHYLLPISFMQCIFGYASLWNLFIVLCFDLTLGAGMFALAYGIVQTLATIKGQVSHEYFVGTSADRRSFLSHIYEVFGEYGYLQFLFPFPSLQLPSDGFY